MLKSHLLYQSFLVLIVTQTCLAENYPQFRGANADAMSKSPLPLTWSDLDGNQTNIRWKMPLEGEGWSQPVVWGDRIFFTAAVPADPSNNDVVRPESNNGGYGRNRNDLVDVDADQFNRVLANASGWFLLARHLHDHVVRRGVAGSIVNIGSMYGQVASYPDTYRDLCRASPVSYHALKGGVIQMTRHLAVYWARDRVRVNCLSPGPFPASTAPQGLAERLEEKSPMGRMGRPHELKGALLLLASDAGSYITGQNVTVDGGWTAW